MSPEFASIKKCLAPIMEQELTMLSEFLGNKQID
jgi:hypothetical protein